ncbi:hypothetical protein D3C76_1490730 [compost metagenome]
MSVQRVEIDQIREQHAGEILSNPLQRFLDSVLVALRRIRGGNPFPGENIADFPDSHDFFPGVL